MIRMGAAAIAMLALVAAPGSAQRSASCAGVASATNKAVCSVPKLVAAEAAMTVDLRVLKRVLPQGQRPPLEANQQLWLRARDAKCSDKPGPLLIDCVLDETEARHRLLAGYGRNGAAGILGDQALMQDYRTGNSEHPGTAAIHLVSYDIAYLSPALATIVFRHVSLEGGNSRPFTARQTLVFDFKLGRPLSPEDVLEKPAQAVGPIAGLCEQRLKKQAAEQGWRLLPRANFADVVNTFQSWAPGPLSVEILYDAEMVAPYSAGGHECRLDYGALLRWLKPGGPLPPH